MKDSLTREEVDTVLRLREEVSRLNDEREHYRQRVKELEGKLSSCQEQELEGDQAITMNRCECGRGKRPSYDKCLVCAYQERGERMKAMREWMQKRQYYQHAPPWRLFIQDMLPFSADGWFDENGEPL